MRSQTTFWSKHVFLKTRFTISIYWTKNSPGSEKVKETDGKLEQSREKWKYWNKKGNNVMKPGDLIWKHTTSKIQQKTQTATKFCKKKNIRGSELQRHCSTIS